jgi:hypothetical protein
MGRKKISPVPHELNGDVMELSGEPPAEIIKTGSGKIKADKSVAHANSTTREQIEIDPRDLLRVLSERYETEISR